MAKNIIKITPTKAIVQIIDAGATISLATDLLFAGTVQAGFAPQVVSGTPKVNITGVTYSLPSASGSLVTRGGANVLALQNSDNKEFQYSIVMNNTSDIVVTCPSGGMVILELSKIGGYSDVIPNIAA